MSATIDLATYKEALIVLTTAGVIVPIGATGCGAGGMPPG